MTRIDEGSEITSPLPDNQEQQNDMKQAADSSRERWLLFVFAVLVLVLDFVTKEMVRNRLPINTYWAPFPALEEFFRITHTSNTGVAFGLFQNANLLFALFATAVSIGIIYFNHKLEPGHPLLRIALGLQLGGALGNLVDRVRLGSVTDFLDFGPWPIFNVADTAVVAGVILMGYVLLKEERREKAALDEASSTEETSKTKVDLSIRDERTSS